MVSFPRIFYHNHARHVIRRTCSCISWHFEQSPPAVADPLPKLFFEMVIFAGKIETAKNSEYQANGEEKEID